MKKILLPACALLLGFAFVGSATAADHHHGSAHVQVHGSAHVDHGVRFSGGYYYRGQDHNHWERRVWDAHYGRYQYYDSYYHCYYYWDAPSGCYYPVCP